ncbi:MAG: sugar ABC transporter substrate-binding protein [Chthonomonadales bacterium]
MRSACVFLCVSSLAVLFGCGPKPQPAGAPPASKSAGESMSVVVISPALTSVFHQQLVQGAEAAAKARGWQFSHLEPDKETNSAMQVAQVQDAIQSGVKAISICAVNDEALVQAVKKANDANVPIFVHNSITPVPGGKVEAYIGYDEREAGRKAGEKAVELLKAKYGTARGKVAILDGTAGSHTDERAGGFKDALKGTQIQVVAEQSANWLRKEGADRTTEFLQKYPDLDLVFGCSDAMAQGAAQAAKQAGKQIFTIGLDGNPDALEDVRNGNLTATVVVFPYEMGEKVIDTIARFHSGEHVPQVIKTDTTVVDRTNVEKYMKHP